MQLPENSLGVSDARQWEQCPKSFVRGMVRHTRSIDDVNAELAAHHSPILAFGSALHDAALLVAHDPDIYIDDAVDTVWAHWGPYLTQGMYEELRQDVAVAIQRTQEATNLELVCAETDMRVPMFIGRSADDGGSGDEVEGEQYYYRFKIDALYQDKNDPGHYIIRDLKSYRREHYQEDIDEDMQFTAYVYGIKALYEEACTRVTIWVDQTKFDEIFSSRTDQELQGFEDWMICSIKSVLATPVETMIETWKLNEFCRWCPLLVNCEVVNHANDLALATIANHRGFDKKAKSLAEPTIKLYQQAKLAKKALEGFTEEVGKFLKDNPGEYAGKKYSNIDVKTPKWTARDAFEVVGPAILDNLPLVSKKAIKEYLDNPAYTEHLMAVRKSGGHSRMSEKKVE